MFSNPVYGPRIVPFGQPRTSADVLPNGRPAFRVTNRFTDPDPFNGYKPHGAIDIANYYCGDSVLNMLRGIAYLLKDPNGALGVEVRHPNGYKTQVWHLAKQTVKNGQSIYKGRRLGYVGKTGLDIGGCHIHIVCYDPLGRKVDIWPLLNQNR